MDLSSVAAFTPAQVYLLTFVWSFVSGFVPLVNTEAYLLSVSALSPSSSLLPIVVSSTTGQMCAKLLLFLAGRGAIRLPLGRYQEKVEKVRASLAQREGGTDVALFLSAFTGLPPFYAVSILAGMLRIRVAHFLVPGFLGRLARFTLVFLFPQLVKGGLG